jgi:multisubunit Na+/H+ antiporter MnhC subunit
LGTARDAFAHAFVMTSIVNALLMLATAVAATLILRQRQSVRAG